MKKLIILVLVILTGCHSFVYTPENKGDEVVIAMTTDIHYIDPSLKDGKTFKESLDKGSDGKLSIYIEELTDAFIEKMIKISPDIVIIDGDLTYNGEKLSHETLASKLQKLKDHDIQPLVIPGNHDIRNIMAYDYRDDNIYYSDWIEADTFKEIYKDAGYSEALSYDDSTLSYLFEASEDLWLFMLDSNTYEKNTGFAPSSVGEIKESTMAWMSKELEKKDPDTDVIVFMHHPVFDIGGAQSYVIDNDMEFIDFLNDHDLKLSISGHIHAQNYMTKALDDIEHTDFGLSSLAVYDHQYTTLTYKDHKVDLKATDLDLEGYSDDPFFTDFDTNARAYFKEYSTNRLVGQYTGEDIAKEVSDALYDLKGEFNIALFSGEGYKLYDLLHDHPLYSDIEKYQDTYAKSFFQDVKTFDVDATKLSIVLK